MNILFEINYSQSVDRIDSIVGARYYALALFLSTTIRRNDTIVRDICILRVTLRKMMHVRSVDRLT